MGRIVDDFFQGIDVLLGPFGTADFEYQRQQARGRSEPTETHVDVHDTGEKLRVVADLSDAAREDVEIWCDGETVTIATDDHRYDQRIHLPVAVDEASATATYNNGVLEVTLARKDASGDAVDA